jgi:hypothetical protein
LGNSISDPATDDILRPSKYLKSDSWQLFSITISSPPAAVSFYFEVRTYSNSIVYWDDFIFEQTVTTGSEEIVFPRPVVYPNPTNHELIISNINNLQHIDIQSLDGAIVWSSEFSGEASVTIPVSSLADGLYIIRILSSGKPVIRKFIKN